MNLDDKSLFLDAMSDVKPLKPSRHTPWQPAMVRHCKYQPDVIQLDNFLTTGFLDILPVDQALYYQHQGLQTGVMDKLRSGKYTAQASLNLLRTPVEKCRQQLYAFIQQAYHQGWRNLHIVHGLARHDKSHANIVRSYLARWLVEFDFVMAFCAAQPADGGQAACYVALKKKPAARDENRERHAKRSR